MLLAVGGCGDDDDARAVELPDLTLPPLTAGGSSLELAELRGPAVVNLWATWCAPCRRELPAFQTVSEARPDVRFIGIDIGEDATKARDFVDELGDLVRPVRRRAAGTSPTPSAPPPSP